MLFESDSETIKGCPLPVRPFLIDFIERGNLLAVILDEQDYIGWANKAFCDTLLNGGPPRGVSFRGLIDPESVSLVEQLDPLPSGEVKAIELRHPISTGLLTISYQFFRCHNGTVCGIGADRTEEKEMITQMEALIDDLNREIVQRTELSIRLEQLATTDFLTSVSNRRYFDKIIKQEWARMARYKSHFSLLILDLDHFKDVNDRFGHQAGDEILKEIAALLKQELRSEDIVARYGGEEFAVIALGAEISSARDLGERLRQRIAEHPMPAGVPRQTISIGISATSGANPPSDISDLIARADSALYKAKHSGRNRVEVYPPQP